MMPSFEAKLAAKARREAAKADPVLAAALRKKRRAGLKGAATRAANKAAAAAAEPPPAQPEPAQAPAEPALTLKGTPRMAPEEALARRQVTAANARATLKRMREDGTLARRRKPRVLPNPNEHTLLGRIDLKLQQLGKRRGEMYEAIGISGTTIVTLGRGKKTLRLATFEKVAKYLGVTIGWLQHGDEPKAPAPAQLIPHTETVFKANGKHHPSSHEARIEHAMTQNIDTTITTLWSLLPMDAKVMVIARVAELVAMQAKR